jgi:hypothetical protein
LIHEKSASLWMSLNEIFRAQIGGTMEKAMDDHCKVRYTRAKFIEWYCLYCLSNWILHYCSYVCCLPYLLV